MKQDTLREILDLPVSDRIRLVKKVLDSIAREQDEFSLSEDEIDELERSVDEHEKNPASGIPLEKVMVQLTRKK